MANLSDLDKLTIFADNLVPHVLSVDGRFARVFIEASRTVS